MTPLEIRPTDGAAEVLGVDLTAITVGEWNQIEAAFGAFGLLVFPDQVMTSDDHTQFAERWGSIIDETPKAQGWLADRSYCEQPTAASVMTLKQPVDGVVTRVASMRQAHDMLSSVTRQALEALQAVHSHGSESVNHPLVIRHPVSGENGLFVNPAFTSSIVGMDEAAGMSLLNELCTHCLLDEFVSEIHWAPAMVVLIDHRSFIHYVDPATRNHISTTRVAGGPLTPAVRPTKADPSLTQRAGATLAGGIITAAMIGIADVLDPEKRTHDIEIVSDAPEEEPLDISLDFGDLPPLD